MRIKSLFCFSFILAFISANTFALEITNGHVLQHKEKVTGNVKLFFSNTNAKKMAAQHKLTADADRSSIDIHSAVEPSKGEVGTPVSITGNQYAHIVNNTGAKQTYRYATSFCVVSQHPSPLISRCAYYFDDVELESGGRIDDIQGPVLQLGFDKPGTFITSVTTFVSGPGVYLGSDARGLLNVSEKATQESST